MILIAQLFKLIFKFKPLRKHYFGLYTKLFKPLALFKNVTSICSYDGDLKIKLNLDEFIQQQIYFLDVYDEQGINFLKKQLQPKHTFIDIGANIGCYSLIASKIVGNKGSVHSFEPINNVFKRLEFNIILNKLSNITTQKKAVYKNSTQLKLHVSNYNNLGMSSIFRHDTESGEIEYVEAISLDEYVALKKITQINLIKMDIEGAELFALKGMKNTLLSLKPIIMMEIDNDVLQNSPVKSTDMIEFLENLNYTQKAIANNGDLIKLSNNKSNYSNFVFIPN